jgi:hypothetical protein
MISTITTVAFADFRVPVRAERCGCLHVLVSLRPLYDNKASRRELLILV